jgi:ABC-type transport system involved in multi-copper enzyme maturation permease subunit
MSPFPLVLLAETVKLCARRSARFGWAMSLGLGLGLPLVLFGLVQAGIVVFGAEAEVYFQPDPARPLIWALHLRNVLLIRVFLLLLGAQSMAGELADRTLREGLLRPVPRYQVLFAKWLALLAWDAVSLVLTFVVGGVLGLAFFGLDGIWTSAFLAYLLNFGTDAALLALTLLVAVLTRSALATLAGLLVVLLVDLVTGWALAMLSTGGIVSTPWVVELASQYPALLNGALGTWGAVLPGGAFDGRSLATLAVVLVGSLGLGVVALGRADVP